MSSYSLQHRVEGPEFTHVEDVAEELHLPQGVEVELVDDSEEGVLLVSIMTDSILIMHDVVLILAEGDTSDAILLALDVEVEH